MIPWAAPRFPDNGIGAISCGELLVQVLVERLLRSPVGECRMETSPIVPELDVPCNVLPCFLPCRVSSPVDTLDFQPGIERFRQAVVETYPGPSHGLADLQPFQHRGELTRSGVAAPVRMKDGAFRGIEVPGGHLD